MGSSQSAPYYAPSAYHAPPAPRPPARAQQPQQPRKVTAAELALHGHAGSAWMCIQGNVWDVTSFLANHPGGQSILMGYVGRDATRAFLSAHRFVDPRRYAKFVGELSG